MDKITAPKKEKRAKSFNKSEVTRQRLLDAAAKTFAELGYGHARLSDIARAAGSYAGGIYYYFPSREELVAELLSICTRRSLSQLKEAIAEVPENATWLDKIHAAATAQLSGIMSQDDYYAAYTRIYPQVPEEVRQRHSPVLHEFFDIWRDLICQAQAAGEIRDDLNPAVLRLTIAGSIQWASEWARNDSSSPTDLARAMMDIFFNGIRVRR